MLVLLIGLPATFYAMHRVDEEIRVEVERMLSSKYPTLTVRVRAAQRRGNEGLEIRGLSISEPGAGGQEVELLHVDEMVVHCLSDWQHLLQGKLMASRVVLRRPLLRMSRRSDGSWNAEQLLPIPKFSERPPEIVVEAGSVEMIDRGRHPPAKLGIRDAHLVAAVPENGPHGPLRQVTGSARGDHVGRIAWNGTLSDTGQHWQLTAKVEGLEISPELQSSLPGAPPREIDWLQSSRAEADLDVEVSYEAARARPLEFVVRGRFARGRIDDDRLPYPLDDVEGTFLCNGERFEINELTGRNGTTTVRLSLVQHGYEPNSPMEFNAVCQQLMVNSRLRDALPSEWRQHWHRFLPSGTVDLSIQSRFDGHLWHPHIQVRCRDLAFTYHEFPYRLQHAEGLIEQQGDRLRVSLAAVGGGQPIRFNGEFQGMGNDGPGELRVHGDRLQLNRQMLDALPSPMRGVITSFAPTGLVNVDARFWRSPGESGPMHREVFVHFHQGAIRYDKFPYPLANVRGTIVCRDDDWTFRDFAGGNDSAEATLSGWYRKSPQGGQWQVDLVGKQVPLESELRAAARPELRRMWDDLSPRGKIDVAVHAAQGGSGLPVNVSIRVFPLGGQTSVQPQFFPYRLEALTGSLLYENDSLTIERLNAQHGRTRFSARGVCDISQGDRWRVRLERVDVDRLEFDRQLRSALPARLAQMVTRVDPRGPIYLRGSLEFASASQSRPEHPVANPATPDGIQANWALTVDLHQTNVDFGVGLQNINGTVALQGEYRNRHLLCGGELAVDSLTYRDVQWTEVRGPIWVDNNRALLGVDAARRKGEQQPRPITARVVGGSVVGEAWVRFDEPSQFGLAASLTDGDLSLMAQEVMPGRQQLRGKILAGIELGGNGSGRHTLSGRGYMRLSEADIYHLPQMVALLKILSIRLPDTNAFTDCNIDYWIDAGHVYFNRINLNGDAISLVGSGQMSPQGNVALTFYAMVGRDNLNVPIVRDVFRGASQQFMLIRVSGPWTEPDIRREPFPGVNQALAELQSQLLLGQPPTQTTPPQQQQPAVITPPATSNLAPGLFGGPQKR